MRRFLNLPLIYFILWLLHQLMHIMTEHYASRSGRKFLSHWYDGINAWPFRNSGVWNCSLLNWALKSMLPKCAVSTTNADSRASNCLIDVGPTCSDRTVHPLIALAIVISCLLHRLKWQNSLNVHHIAAESFYYLLANLMQAKWCHSWQKVGRFSHSVYRQYRVGLHTV